VERRLSGDRRAQKLYNWRGAERRTGHDRRTTSQKRITLSQGYGAGWLTFESLLEKRRLIPIPSNWENIPQADLRELCEKAKPVAKIDNAGAA